MRLRPRLIGSRVALLLLVFVGLAPIAGTNADTIPARPAGAAAHARPGPVYARPVGGTRRPAHRSTTRETLDTAYGKLPLSFEINQGQAGAGVDFVAHTGNSALFLTSTDAVLALSAPAGRQGAPRPRLGGRLAGQKAPMSARPHVTVLRLHLLGANPHPQVAGQIRLPGVVNYLIGRDRRHWRTHIHTYGRVAYRDVYKGIDLAYYGTQGHLEYDFVVAPGARPALIHFAVGGTVTTATRSGRHTKRTVGAGGKISLRLDRAGNLVMDTAAGVVRQDRPVAYQVVGGKRRPVVARFVLRGGQVGFAVGHYDPRHPLVIDPVLTFVYATWLPLPDGSINGFTRDAAGDTYVVGAVYLRSNTVPDLPATLLGPGPRAAYGRSVVVVMKLSPDGGQLLYNTYIGGTQGNAAQANTGLAIAADASGATYITGRTTSDDFPTTPNAYQTTPKDTGDPGNTFYSAYNAFAARLSADGSALLYSTYLGGTEQHNETAYDTSGSAIAVDAAGNLHVAGMTQASDFPTTAGAVQTSGVAGGNGLQSSGFLSVIHPGGNGASDLLYSTYLGGTNNASQANAVALDAAGNSYVAGATSASNLVTTTGALRPPSSSREPSRALTGALALPIWSPAAGVMAQLPALPTTL